MNTLDYLIKQDDQLSQSMPECENINRDGKKKAIKLNYKNQF